MKLGIIGLDSSHALEFTRLLNRANRPGHVREHPITAACAGVKAEDFDMSYERMDKITRTVTEEWGVQLYPDISSVMEQVDAVLLEQVDARIRVRQFEEIISYRKPVFVDKPFALSTAECCRMLELADQYSVPVLSASSLRFADSLTEALKRSKGRQIHGADFFGPMPFVETQPGYFWYGVHMADMLYRTMGMGCSRVQAIHTEHYDLITGIWRDGRLGTIRGNRIGNGNFGGTVFFGTESETIDVSKDVKSYYESLVEAIISMFDTGISPVGGNEMAEIVRFLEASNESWMTGREIAL